MARARRRSCAAASARVNDRPTAALAIPRVLATGAKSIAPSFPANRSAEAVHKKQMLAAACSVPER